MLQNMGLMYRNVNFIGPRRRLSADNAEYFCSLSNNSQSSTLNRGGATREELSGTSNVQYDVILNFISIVE